MELTDSLKIRLIETAKSLQGSARRLCMARTVQELGPGGPQRAARELGWGRMTMRKGLRELATGVIGIDAIALRGRQRVEAHLPTLLTDLHAIVESQSQADPRRPNSSRPLRRRVHRDRHHVRIERPAASRRRAPAGDVCPDRMAGRNLQDNDGSLTDAYHLAGVYTGRILKGEKPADLLVEQGHEGRADHQPHDRQGDRHRRAAPAHRAYRRGHRMRPRYREAAA